MDRAKMSGNERVLHFENTLDEKELYRFLYLDSYISSRYPDFYKEFTFINSIFCEAVSSGLFTQEEIYSLSIYPRKFIEPYFNHTRLSETILPKVNEIRMNIWHNYVKDNPEYSLLGQYPFNKWAVVRFLNAEESSCDDPVASPLINAECLVIDSENIHDISKTFNVAITMFGEKREFVKDRLYLINYCFDIKTHPLNYPNDSSSGIENQMRFVSHCRGIYSLSKDDTIEKYRPTHFSITIHPLEKFDFKTSKEVISSVIELRKRLNVAGDKY
jgi:hypothetical protein